MKYLEEKEEIINFLIKAKKATYAGKGGETSPSRPASHDLKYQEGDYLYIDTYLGGEMFAGEEALWIKNNPFWAMNYIGRIIAEGFSGDFLKEALLNVPKEHPFRGPKYFKIDNYEYKMDYQGDFQWFTGKEEIYYKGKLVYDCLFSGCILK